MSPKINIFTSISVVLFSVSSLFSQEATATLAEKYTARNKGKFFIFWGGNRDSYSKSDIHFKGADYDFTIHDVVAVDRPKGWHVDYIIPTRMTIPQTNFRMGYFISDKYSIGVGVDHMKYVMYQNQNVAISGNYPASYNGNQINDGILNLTDENFLTFEHTDGLNFVHAEISRFDDFSKIFKIKNTDKFQVNLTEGFSAGLMYPKTNSKLLGNSRYDDYHVSGYGVAAKVGLNLTFFKHYFIQTELKGGYINMNDIKTTFNNTDSASQEFFFLQEIISFGGIFKI